MGAPSTHTQPNGCVGLACLLQLHRGKRRKGQWLQTADSLPPRKARLDFHGPLSLGRPPGCRPGLAGQAPPCFKARASLKYRELGKVPVLGLWGVPESQSVDTFGNLVRHTTACPKQMLRALEDSFRKPHFGISEDFVCLFVCACFLILVFAGCTLIFPRCFVCCQKNRILATGLCPGHLVLCFPLCVLATLPTGNRSRPQNVALLLLF